MDPYYELAYALESQSLCLFVGTGFSKHLTGGEAPSWMHLLQDVCKSIEGGEDLAEQLFPNDNPIMSLEECASIIKLKLESKGYCLHSEIAKRLEDLRLNDDATETRDIIEALPPFKFITTNYDLLIEKKLLRENLCTSYSIGYPISRQMRDYQVYHIHGSIKFPRKMVVTADDYFRFINFPSYFSKKVQTLIQENTTVIIGYSLSDVNFKAILNHQRANKTSDINRQNLFFLSRDPIDKHIKDYYDKSYGLRVIDETNIEQFLRRVSNKHELIKSRVKQAREKLMSVLDGDKKYTDEFLKKNDAFYEVIATLSSNGIIVSHPRVVNFLTDILARKSEFTQEDGAWAQYTQLAKWLLHVGAIMDIRETPLEKVYLESVERSFSKMSKRKVLGKSWGTYLVWRKYWLELTYANRQLIYDYYRDKEITEDIREIFDQ